MEAGYCVKCALCLLVYLQWISSVNPASPRNGEVHKFFGQQVKGEEFDSTEFTDFGGGPVKDAHQLDTSFKFSACWINADHFSFRSDPKWWWIKGNVSPERMNHYFKTEEDLPDDNSLAVFSLTRRRPTDAAYFESCSLSCLTGPVNVTLKFWTSKGVVLEVCYRQVFLQDGPPQGCQQIPTGKLHGRESITLNIVEPLTAIIIKASNFVDPAGSVVIIDDITVDYHLCSDIVLTASGDTSSSDTTTPPSAETTTTIFSPIPIQRIPVTPATPATPGTPTAAVPTTESPSQNSLSELLIDKTCDHAPCTFDVNLCAYRNVDVLGGVVQPVTIQSGVFKNHLTGIRSGPGGKRYAAVYLSRGQMAAIESGPINLVEERIIQLDLFEATQGITTRMCFDHQYNCPNRTRGYFQKDERTWKVMTGLAPKGTGKIIIISENTDNNEGAVGYANLRLMTNSRPPTSVCTAPLAYRRSAVFNLLQRLQLANQRL